MGNIPYFDILILAMIAVFIFNRLRSVLGKKTGNETKSARDFGVAKKSYKESNPDNTIKTEFRNKNSEINISFHPDKKINDSLNKIKKIEKNFEMDEFLDKAKKAFEYILNAYANNNVKALEALLEKDIFLEYKKAIENRIKKKQMFEVTIIGINKPEIVDVNLENNNAEICVRYDSEQIHVTKDSKDNVLDGDVNQILTIQEEWMFFRKLKSKNPNWSLLNISEVK